MVAAIPCFRCHQSHVERIVKSTCRTLLIGSCHSPYLRSLAKAIEPHGFAVDLVDPYEGWHQVAGSSERCYYAKREGKLSKFDQAKELGKFLADKEYDVCNVHYNSVTYGLVAGAIRKAAKKRLVVSIWGGDMYPGWLVRHFQCRLLNRADAITINNPQMVDELVRLFWLDRSKIEVAFMPLEILTLIETEIESVNAKEKAKASLGWREDEMVVLCGTNAWPEQAHLKMLDSIEKSWAEHKVLQQNVLYVFPLTYEGSSDYIEQVETRVKESKLNAVVLRDYLSNDELVQLRIATDVMLLLQNRDMFSAALQEALFAGSEVISGQWLPYQFLDAEVEGLHLVPSIDDAGDKLAEVVESFPSRKIAKRAALKQFGGLIESGETWAGILSGGV